MKILITTDAYDSMINGVAVSVKSLSTALRDAGNDVRILTLSQTHQSSKKEDVYYIGSMPLKIYPDARATFSFHDPYVKEILEWHPDVIHSQSEFSTFVFARKIAKKLNIPIIHTYHTLYEYYTHYFCPSKALGQKIVAAGSRFICNRTDAVIAPTEKTARVLENYNVTAPLNIIPTGLSLERFQRPIDSSFKRQLRAQLHIPENTPVIVTLGRLAREKNVDFLIQQMQHPKLKQMKLHLIIVGDGPDRECLEAMVHNLGLRNTVHFTGMVSPENVAQYYRLGDVFVSASNSETQGLTYIEAMACGLPLLCLEDPCLNSVLIPAFNGFFFQDADSFVQRCIETFEVKDFLKSLQENALQCSFEFSKEAFARRALQLYKNMKLKKEEKEKCTRFVCIPKQIWPKGMGY